MKKSKIPFYKEKVNNGQSNFEWEYGDPRSNIILINKKLNIKLYRYNIISSENGNVLYDTIGFNEPNKNAVILIRNEKKQFGLLKEWRPIPSQFYLATPRGMALKNDLNLISSAKREALEEVGDFKILKEQVLGRINQNTTFVENSVGVVLFDVSEGSLKVDVKKAGEALAFGFYGLTDVKRLIKQGTISDAFTLSAFAFVL